MEEVPMPKSSLQEFEARLVLHEMGEPLLKKSIEEARRAGYLPNRKSRYFGRKKTCFQLVMAAVMANLSLVVGFCRRQAQQVVGVAKKRAVELANSFLAAVLTLWDRYFGWAGLVWV
jgi:hypothetical protein